MQTETAFIPPAAPPVRSNEDCYRDQWSPLLSDDSRLHNIQLHTVPRALMLCLPLLSETFHSSWPEKMYRQRALIDTLRSATAKMHKFILSSLVWTMSWCLVFYLWKGKFHDHLHLKQAVYSVQLKHSEGQQQMKYWLAHTLLQWCSCSSWPNQILGPVSI